MHQQDFISVYDRYNNELRPLVSEIEGRLTMFEEPLLLDVYNQFSGIANDDVHSCMHYMDCSIVHAYEYLIYYLQKNNQDFKKKYSMKTLNGLLSGRFIGKYISNTGESNRLIRSVRCNNNVSDKMRDYKKAYVLLSENESLIYQAMPELAGSTSVEKDRRLVILRHIVSIFVSIIVGVCFSYIGC